MLRPWSIAWLLASACATGAPVGAGLITREGYAPFARGAPAEAPPTPPDAASAPLAAPPGSRDTAVRTARALVGSAHVAGRARRYHDDCTGLVSAAYGPLGIDLMSEASSGDSGVMAIYRYATHHGRIYEGGRPLPGDLVFFRETYDRNRDGHANDGLTHVALVEDVEADGTVVIIHRVAHGVVRYRMNLAHPDAPAASDGRRWNDWLRSPRAGARPQLTAQLFAGFATLLPVESRLSQR
jgi:peptidoglycan DL-endopeptidase CwlO